MKKEKLLKEILYYAQEVYGKHSNKDVEIDILMQNIKQQMEFSRLIPSDRSNPLICLITKVFYNIMNEMANDNTPNGSKTKIEDYIIKFLNKTLTIDEPVSNKTTLGVTTTKQINPMQPYKMVGYDRSGFPIYDFSQPNYIEETTNSSLGGTSNLTTQTPEFTTSLPTTGNLEYDAYLDAILKWGKENKIEFGPKTSLAGFCHALNLFQKESTLTQPETDAGKLYTAFMKRFFKKK